MKISELTESQIVGILKHQDAAMSISEICCEQGISQLSFFSWKKKYLGMDANNLEHLNEVKAKNSRLKRMFADVSL